MFGFCVGDGERNGGLTGRVEREGKRDPSVNFIGGGGGIRRQRAEPRFKLGAPERFSSNSSLIACIGRADSGFQKSGH